ncbi:hypothetical protein [Limosilactobacillus reuteri]|uniref:hypothetical protein n=1 Tax=Limosilactobacillus reuteri TaxID=1598 RepID=UPI000F01BB72|nr:hypothetical protein [Limosilactobacillus reuteri]RMX26170.1 hypothetical protein C6H63_08540 [Limosilactobacillus reuteri]
METIKQVNGMYISPFFQLSLENNIYTLKNFSDKVLIKWKNNSTNTGTYDVLEQLQKALRQEVLINRREYLFEQHLCTTINQKSKLEVPKIVIVNQLLVNLHNYEINFVFLKNGLINKQKVFKTNDNAVKEFNILLLLEEPWQQDQLKDLLNQSQAVLFTKKNAETYTIGPFLEKTHLLGENLEIILRHSQPQVVTFFEKDIFLLGLRKFIKQQWNDAIIEYFSKYLYQSSPLYNRQFFVKDNGMISVSDFLPLY